ncbi:hypothetical protein [Paremcibacter congregatus]|uniref:hypothetical protein n=1 Tax=Paremcibacter congregatus TaxID=2043170 RepID=UPI0030EE77BB|tara:strand:+ start:3587 stop:3964 length:378 start_codon:yes stop_codon:yes gene_type:complete
MTALQSDNAAITIQTLRNIFQDLALAAGGCMRAHPTKAQRLQLRSALCQALKALKAPVHHSQSEPTERPDPAQMLIRYVDQGGDWQALIAAIHAHGRTGQTKRIYSNPTKENNHDENNNTNTRSH